MKHLIVILNLIIFGAATAICQTQADIDRIFTSHARQDDNAKEIIISGDALKGTDIKSYHSLVITGSPAEAETIADEVKRCATNAIGREVERIGGNVYFAKYTLPSTAGDKYNRYLLFLNTHLKGGNTIKVIYIVKKGDLDKLNNQL